MRKDPDVTAEACYAAFRAHYIKAQYHWVQFTTEWLSECSRTFEGDLQMMLILSVVGQPHLARKDAAGGEGPMRAAPTINASRIADLTGIPRETVRRKLQVMAARGWVQQSADAAWSINVVDGRIPVRESLGELEDVAIRKISGFVALLASLARHHPST